jgi:hypothetical protein
VLSTPPAFVLSQNQTLQTKTTHPKTGESESEKSDQATRKNLAQQKSHTPTRGRQDATKNKQQTKTTKHTIEFSNNTPSLACSQGNPASLSHRIEPGQIRGPGNLGEIQRL